MIFLNPSVLLGLLAASVPILIHLLNLRKLKKVEFSTLSFLKELQKTKIRKIKLKQWILLALRVIIILLIVSAFARPTLEQITIGDSSSAAKTTAVFIIDNSYSMSVVTDNGSNFNQAKKTIKKVSDILQEGDEIYLLSSSSTKSTINSISLNSISKELDDVIISTVSGTLSQSILTAAKILERSENFNKEIYLLSDFQSNEFDDNIIAPLRDQLTNEYIKFYTIPFGISNISNLSITNFKINNQIFELNKQIDLSVTVTNFTDIKTPNKIVSLFVNDIRKAQNNIELSPGETKTINFNVTIEETGLLNLFVELEDDDILHDNKMYQAIYVPEKYEILLLEENSTDTRFLKLALTEANLANNINLTVDKLVNNTAINLKNFKVVMISGTSDNFNFAKFNDYLKEGGKIILFPSENNTLLEFQRFCSMINSIPSPSQLVDLSAEENSFIEFDDVDFEHAIFKNLFDLSAKKEIDSPELFKYFLIQTGGLGKSIISLSDGSTFMSEYSSGNGKIILFNAPPTLKNSTFPFKGIFAPLINKTVSYLASETSDLREYFCGKEIQINVEGLNIPQLEIKNSDGNSEYITFDINTSGNFVTYHKTEKPGVYSIFSGDQLIDFAVVNYNPMESELLFLENEKIDIFLDNINFKGNHINLEPEEDLNKTIYQARFGTELWKYFLMIALLLALIEMWISRSSKKDLAYINKEI